jgi:hypothetical protein
MPRHKIDNVEYLKGWYKIVFCREPPHNGSRRIYPQMWSATFIDEALLKVYRLAEEQRRIRC